MRALFTFAAFSIATSLLVTVSSNRLAIGHGQIRTQGSIVGTIMDKHGAVISKAKITVRNKETNAETTTESNDYGAFRVSNLEQGKYVITVSAPGFKTSVLDNYAVAPGMSSDVKIVLPVGTPVNGKIKGVVGGNHQPIGHARITIVRIGDGTSNETETDPQGRYENPGLPPGEYRVKAEVSGHPSQEKRVTLGPRQVKAVDFNF